MKTLSTKKQGFTIIEVVLVLAIAGLIFLMVFVALPSMQRSQRDTQRRSDMARLATALTNYQANNDNSLPGGTRNTECPPSTHPGNPNSGEIVPNNITANISSNKACLFLAAYLNPNTSSTNEFKDPDGTTYGVTIPRSGASKTPTDFNHTAYINREYKCTGENIESTGNPNDFAILYKLEGSGTICIDNQ